MPAAKLASEPTIFWLPKKGALYYDPLLDDGGPELRMMDCRLGESVKFVREIVSQKLRSYHDVKVEEGVSEPAINNEVQSWLKRFADKRRKWIEQLTAPGSDVEEESRSLDEDAHELAGEVEVAVHEVAADGYTELTGELEYGQLPEGETLTDDETIDLEEEEEEGETREGMQEVEAEAAGVRTTPAPEETPPAAPARGAKERARPAPAAKKARRKSSE